MVVRVWIDGGPTLPWGGRCLSGGGLAVIQEWFDDSPVVADGGPRVARASLRMVQLCHYGLAVV